MKTTILVLMVLVMFSLPVGCSKHPTKPEHGQEKIIGINTGIYYADDWFSTQDYINIRNSRIPKLAEKHVNAIVFKKGIYYFENHIHSEVIGRNLNNDGIAGCGNLSDQQLIALAATARANGLDVHLAIDFVVLVEDPNGWFIINGKRVSEGTKHTFVPNNTNVFFNEYTQAAKDGAILAAQMGAKIYNFGQEMQMISGSQYNQYWNQMMDEIGSVYSGKTVYYSNNGHYGAPDDEFNTLCSALKTRPDYIGCTMYIQGISNLPNPSLDLIREGVAASFQIWEARANAYGKKVIIGETGCGSYDGALSAGYLGQMYNEIFLSSVNVNEEIQKNYYIACLENLRDKEFIFGICWDKSYYLPWNLSINEKGPSPFSDQITPKSMLDAIKMVF